MLEIKNLTKVYKTKGGVDVKALNDVSTVFPETGMVFLLGKSGSGKSTLLNVCGGLDSPTSGEIIVKGKSSKNFTQSDFDSYRNTFVGFIFQEYNILNEFTVEENIALALELQGKSKDKEAINELLDKVDLKGYGNRKPNTLSGGQKQRIAIARALIKSPEIIMADEPTGALDSATGKQVFETLKKLSKDTLVMVVSHDREFAETYADRIIELKDGKIISDVTKTSEKEEKLSSNVSVVGNTLCIKNGSKLTDNDFSSIKSFLSTTDNDVIISKSEEDIKKIKKITKINDKGEKEVFKDTIDSNIELKNYKKEDSKFIKSKLPLRHAFKIGVSSLKNKPIRLLFTIGLCASAFVMFGILSTMTFYNSDATFIETLKNSNYDLIQMSKEYEINETNYEYGEEIFSYSTTGEGTFNDEELKKYVNQFGNQVFGGVTIYSSFSVQSSPSKYWLNKINTIAYLNEANSLHSTINGSYPKNDDEIVISSYTANVIFNNKIYDNENNKLVDLKKPEDVIGKKINIDGQTYKVTGIFDSGIVDPKYDVIANGTDYSEELIVDFQEELEKGLHLIAFGTKDKIEQISDNYYSPWTNGDFSGKTISAVAKQEGEYKFTDWSNALYSGYSNANKEDVIQIKDFEQLKNNEVVVSRNLFAETIMTYYNEKLNKNWNEETSKKHNLAVEIQSGYKSVYNSETDSWESVSLTKEELISKTKELINSFKKENKNLTIGIKLFDDMARVEIGSLIEANIVGVWMDGNNSYSQSKVLFNDTYANELWAEQLIALEDVYTSQTNYKKEGSYSTIFLPYDKSEEQTNMLLDIFKTDKYDTNDSKSVLTNAIITDLSMVDSFIKDASKIFLYMGIALAVFAILLFSNFISVSISQKTKEIGILRAVGARSNDVFKIFFSESFLIMLICVILSIMGSVFICNLLNNTLASRIGVTIFVFGIMSLIILILIALITSIIATFLPVYKAAHKKPVESIRSL